MRSILFVITLILSLAKGQSKTLASDRSPGQLKQAVTETENASDASIRELINILLIDEKIQESMNAAEKFFTLKPNLKSKDVAQVTLIKERAKINYDKSKSDIKRQVTDQMVTEFKKKFTAAEIKYLIDVVKFPVFKRLSQILSSDEFQDALNLPSTKVSEFMKQANKEFISAKPDKKVVK